MLGGQTLSLLLFVAVNHRDRYLSSKTNLARRRDRAPEESEGNIYTSSRRPPRRGEESVMKGTYNTHRLSCNSALWFCGLCRFVVELRRRQWREQLSISALRVCARARARARACVRARARVRARGPAVGSVEWTWRQAHAADGTAKCVDPCRTAGSLQGARVRACALTGAEHPCLIVGRRSLALSFAPLTVATRRGWGIVRAEAPATCGGGQQSAQESRRTALSRATVARCTISERSSVGATGPGSAGRHAVTAHEHLEKHVGARSRVH